MEGKKKEGYKKGVSVFGIDFLFLRHYVLPMLYMFKHKREVKGGLNLKRGSMRMLYMFI